MSRLGKCGTNFNVSFSEEGEEYLLSTVMKYLSLQHSTYYEKPKNKVNISKMALEEITKW